MKQAVFAKMVRENFSYLLDDYGFSLAYQSGDDDSIDKIIGFASGRCGIVFIMDKGRVYIDVLSADFDGPWQESIPQPSYDIAIVMACLWSIIDIKEQLKFYPPFEWALPLEEAANNRLVKLVSKTQSIWPSVIRMAKDGTLGTYRSEFERLENKLSELLFKELEKKAKRAREGFDDINDRSLLWKINRKYLENGIERGDKFLLASILRPDPTAAFAQEVEYLLARGFKRVRLEREVYLQASEQVLSDSGFVFIGSVQKHFGYLLNNHGLQLAHQFKEWGFNDQSLVFASGRCGIRFLLQERRVNIEVVSSESNYAWTNDGLNDHWVDLGILIGFLQPELKIKELAQYYTDFREYRPYSISIDRQLEKLLKRTGCHWDQIIEMAKSGELSTHSDDFERLRFKLVNELRNYQEEQHQTLRYKLLVLLDRLSRIQIADGLPEKMLTPKHVIAYCVLFVLGMIVFVLLGNWLTLSRQH